MIDPMSVPRIRSLAVDKLSRRVAWRTTIPEIAAHKPPIAAEAE